MSVSSDIAAQGILTGGGTTDTVYTATRTCYIVITVNEYSGNTRQVEFFVNGSADQNRRGRVELQANWFAIWRVKLGSGDTARIKASAATSVSYTVELDSL